MKQSITKKRLIRQYHAVCSSKGLTDEERKVILAAYNVQSSTELNESQLFELIDRLQNPQNDKWRKRVMAAIASWMKSANMEINSDKIKAIACRASGYNYFNAIPVSRLREIYYEFCNKAKTRNNAKLITGELVNNLEILN